MLLLKLSELKYFDCSGSLGDDSLGVMGATLSTMGDSLTSTDLFLDRCRTGLVGNGLLISLFMLPLSILEDLEENILTGELYWECASVMGLIEL